MGLHPLYNVKGSEVSFVVNILGKDCMMVHFNVFSHCHAGTQGKPFLR